MFDYISELGVPDETVSFFLAIFIGTFTISLLIGLAIYLLESISVYKMAKSAEIKNPWLAGAANPSCRTMLNLSNTYLYFVTVKIRIAKVKHSSA